MPTVVHVVATSAFAGVERYITDAALASTDKGWDASVIGGHPERMRETLGDRVSWLPGSTATQAMRSLRRLRRPHICHAHMTAAEAACLVMRPLHRAPVVATRHFARTRGTSWAGRAASPWLARGLSAEVAISNFVAKSMERAPDAVILNGVPPAPLLWKAESRTVLVLQRLEAEKDTLTALLGWQASGLSAEGWTLRVVGNGSQRSTLQEWVETKNIAGVEFADWTSDVSAEFARAGVLLAPAPAEPFGLTVVEAMAAGVPVVAAAAGGHLETVGRLGGQGLFPPRDGEALGAVLRTAVSDAARRNASSAGRALAGSALSIQEHVRQLLQLYDRVLTGTKAAG